MDREEQLKRKADEIQTALSEWGLEQGLIQSGECLIFSLRLEKVAIAECESVEDCASDGRRRETVTPRQIYNAARRVAKKTGRFSMQGTEEELGSPRPSMMGCFSIHPHPFRVAYFAAKNGHPYPPELDTDESLHEVMQRVERVNLK